MKKSNYHLTVFVGDTDNTVSASARSYDSTAFILDFNNYQEFFNNELLKNTTVYTSLGDLPKDIAVIQDLLWAADEIFYCPPHQWSDQKNIDTVSPTSCNQGLTEHLLLTLAKDKKIYNFDRGNLVPDPISLADHRQINDSQLWIAGCSISHGVGVESIERYGSHVADSLSMSCSFLTCPGSSVDWAADQILRSDIRPKDIVIWGITANERVTVVHNDQLSLVTLQKYQQSNRKDRKILESIVPEKTLLSQNTFYKHIYSIKQVINFCNKCQAKLFMVGIIPSDNAIRYLATLPEYHHYPYQQAYKNNSITSVFEDYGTDGIHPGPVQHKRYADFILNLI